MQNVYIEQIIILGANSLYTTYPAHTVHIQRHQLHKISLGVFREDLDVVGLYISPRQQLLNLSLLFWGEGVEQVNLLLLCCFQLLLRLWRLDVLKLPNPMGHFDQFHYCRF